MSEEEIKKLFSQNLNFYLSLNGKVQKDLVNYMHVSSSTASNWCTGQKLPRMDKIQSIANWLGIEKSDLLENKLALPDTSYKLDHELREFTIFLQDNPEYKKLFQMTQRINKDDIELVSKILEKFRND